MAIIKACTRDETKLKFPLPNAYFKISSIRQEDGKVNITLKGYADETARRSTSETPSYGPPGSMEGAVIYDKSFSVSEGVLPAPTKQGLTPANIIKHCCYLYLRSGEFSAGTDKFEEGQ